jgi:pimeloyl-ACP methyl ester carboxylesterase
MTTQTVSGQARTALLQRKTVRTDDGVTIAYTVRGEGLRTLLFMHGWGGAGTGFLWDELVAHLDLTGLRVLCADYRGHGASDKVETGYTHERFARDMFAIADQEGVDRLVLVGFSMAGQFVQYMTYLAPERVQGQILISAAAAAAYGAPHEALQAWVEAAPYPERFREILVQFIAVPPKAELIDQYCAAVASTPRVALESTMHMFNDLSIVEQAQQIRVPTLVIGPTLDPLMSPDYFRQNILALLPGARLALLHCGHEVPLEMPQAAAGLIEAFLAGLGAQY